MIVILDGNEAVFKTTIANKVSEKLGIPVIKGSSFELSECTNEELFNHFKEQAQMDNIIIDRSIWSNRVYATLYNDYAILTDQQRRDIEDMIRHKATVYYLFADDDVIKERIRQRGDDYVDVDMIEKINLEYNEAMMDCTIRIQAYDTGEWQSSEIAAEIVEDYLHKLGK